MKKLSLSQIAGMSCMIFAIFFGAGNMIFPPAMAQQAGSNSLIALMGFIVSDVGIAIAGLMAVVIAGTSMEELASRISPKFARLLTMIVYLCIGPLFAMPRCGSVSFEIGLLPFIGNFSPQMASFLFTLIFFALTYFLSIREGKIVDIVGKILTPLLLLCILFIFIKAAINPIGTIGNPHGDYSSIPFFKGMIEGYLALDGFAGLVFAILVIQTFKNFKITEKKYMFKYAFICSLFAGILLIAVYAALLYVGVLTSSMELFDNGGTLLTYVTYELFGIKGNIILAVTVGLACLTTSIGLGTSFADYLVKENPKRQYRWTLLAVCGLSFIFSNVGLNHLIAIVLPLLVMIYPIVTILIFVSLAAPYLKSNDAFMMKLGMIFAFPFSFMDGLKTAGVILPEIIENIPLFSVGLGWFIPGLIGCGIGYFIKEKNDGKI